MKVNTRLLPVKLHYFFLFAGTAPMLPYLPLYMNQNLNISYTGVGLIYTVLPFVGLIAKAGFGALTDWFRIHRPVFLVSILLCGISFFCVYFSPPLNVDKVGVVAEVKFDCSSPTSYLRQTLQDSSKTCASSLEDIKLHKITTCEFRCSASSEDREKLCSYLSLKEVECLMLNKNFSVSVHLNESLVEGLDLFIPVSKLSSAPGVNIDNVICEHPLHVPCQVLCENDALMQKLGAPPTTLYSSYGDILNQGEFWALFILINLAWSALAICVVMSDTICFQLLGSEPEKYGHQRLFGSVGWGTVVILTGFFIDLMSRGSQHKNYTSAFILTLAIMFIDFFVALPLKVPNEQKGNSGLKSVAHIFKNVRISLFCLCCIVVGMSTGILWTYQLMMVEEVVKAWNCDFQHMKLLEGLIIGMSCFGGELPFFFISGFFLKKLGHINAMSLVLAVFGLRFVLYWAVKNPWVFLPIELLNGLTFGIFYTTMTSYASIVAPEGAEATMQGIVGALFEGIGVASGNFIGGSLIGSFGGQSMYLYVGILNLFFAALHIFAQALIQRFVPPSDVASAVQILKVEANGSH